MDMADPIRSSSLSDAGPLPLSTMKSDWELALSDNGASAATSNITTQIKPIKRNQ